MSGILLARRGPIAIPRAAAVEELFPDFVPDGAPISWAATPSAFTLNNYSVITDGGQPALALTDPFTVGTALTTRTDIQAARIQVKFRAQPGSGLNLTNIALSLAARYQDANNYYLGARAFGDGNSSYSMFEIIGGGLAVAGALGGDLAMDNTDSTTYRQIVLDVFQDVMRGKEWFVGGGEPGWKGYPTRMLPTSGFGGSTNDTSNDNIAETGACGVRAQYGAVIQDIIVQPLTRSSPNLLLNSRLDPELMTSTGEPFFWNFDSEWNSETTGICNVALTQAASDGVVKPLLRAARTLEGSGGGGPMWEQTLYITGAPSNPFYARQRPIPTVGAGFPTSLAWRLKTKGNNVANSNPGTKLTARWVNYYFGADGSLEMGTGPGGTGGDYHFPVGPNNGIGTWDWTEFSGVMPVYSNADVVQLRIDVGLHDQTAIGELFIEEPSFELVP